MRSMVERARTAMLALALAVSPALAGPSALAAELPALRGDVTASRDVLTLGDLIANAPPGAAETPLFRAPALGATGTIQASRIAAAAQALGVARIETGGRTQIAITRAARHVGASEIEAAIRTVLAREQGLDPVATGIAFDGPPPALVLPPDLAGGVSAADVTLDRRTRRVGATVWLGPSSAERRAQLRVTGALVDLVEVMVAARGVERGQSVRAADITIERRARDLVPPEAVADAAPIEGRVARRAMPAGSLVRPGDLSRPEIVGRGDLVTVVYESAAIALSLRGTATGSGALGDTVAVVNPQSKKTLQAVVIGPGRVSVAPAGPGRLAAAAAGAP